MHAQEKEKERQTLTEREKERKKERRLDNQFWPCHYFLSSITSFNLNNVFHNIRVCHRTHKKHQQKYTN